VFKNPPGKLIEELINPLVVQGKLRIEQIVSRGHCSPEGFWYDQVEDEWVMVLKGSAKLRFEDGCIDMNPGDHFNIRAHSKHRVEWTTPTENTVWLAVFYPTHQTNSTYVSRNARDPLVNSNSQKQLQF
jgi:cupin 2 domain-containing protein